MRILVTGGTGYVGRTLVKKLMDEGHDLRLLVRRNSAHKVDPHAGYEILHGDVLDTHACLRAVEGMDAIVNLVGIIREYPETGTTYEALHTSATYSVVNAGRRHGVKRMVQMSANGAGPDARSRYHQTKFEAEEIVRNSGMRWTIFRPSIIFAPGGEFVPMVVDLVRRPIVPIIDGGKSLFQPVSLANITDAMSRCLTMPETQGEVYHVGGPDRIAFIDLVNQVAEHYKVWMNTIKVSSRMMKPAVKVLQRFKSFPLTYDQLIMLGEDNVCDPQHFVDTFGIELDSFLTALPSLLDSTELATA